MALKFLERFRGNGANKENPKPTLPTLDCAIETTRIVNKFFTDHANITVTRNESADREIIYYGKLLLNKLLNLDPNLPQNKYDRKFYITEKERSLNIFLSWISDVMIVLAKRWETITDPKIFSSPALEREIIQIENLVIFLQFVHG